MLRPIKSILTFLNTNASSLFSQIDELVVTTSAMSDGNNENSEIVSQQEPSAAVESLISKEAAATDVIHSQKNSLTQKTPHDQNENEVMQEVIDVDENESNKDEFSNISSSTRSGDKIVDLTDERSDDSPEKVLADETETVIESNRENTKKPDDIEFNSTFEEDEVISVDDKDTSLEDCCIVSSDSEAQPKDHDDRDDCADENETRVNLDLSLESNEVIILVEGDHNVSFSDPACDPLAMDDYNVVDISNNILPTTQNRVDPSDLEISAIYNTNDTVEIVDSRQHVLSRKDALSNGDSSTTYNGNILREDVTSEEQEVRSDGSDSGLGLESSTLQSANSSMVVSSPTTLYKPTKGNLKRRSEDLSSSTTVVDSKRPKRSINFNGVNIYYFPRVQGFGCVPSQGGCTLGMASRHTHSRTFTLTEHSAEQRRVHKQQMAEINPRGSSSDDTDSDEEISEQDGSDLDADGSGFLQPVPAKQRRALLKAAGIRKIDPTEKDECRAIRSSREFCGCSCRGYCDPETCWCSQSGIKCQVDRPNFPCGCTRDGCANVIGRVEFNPGRVRTHYIHTIMRLDIENKQRRPHEIVDGSTASILSYVSSSVVASSINSCSSVGGTTSLTSYNYSNLVSVNNIKNSQIYGGGDASCLIEAEHSRPGIYLNGGIYSNRLNGSTSPSSSLLQTDGSPMLKQPRPTSSNFILGGDSQDIDLHYAFRDSSSASNLDISPTTTPTGTNNLLGLGDFASTPNTLYNDVYPTHSFLNQTYTNSAFCSPDSLGYQQNFLGYSPNTSSSIIVPDLISSPSPVDPVNDDDLICDDVTDKYTMPYIMASSAQTSTSIAEGTQTTITQPHIAKSTTITLNLIDESKIETFVDLTERITPTEEAESEAAEAMKLLSPGIDVRPDSSSSDVIDVTPKTITIDVDSSEESAAGEEVWTVSTSESTRNPAATVTTIAFNSKSDILAELISVSSSSPEIIKTTTMSEALQSPSPNAVPSTSSAVDENRIAVEAALA